MIIDPSDRTEYQWLITYLALLECPAPILHVFWCQLYWTLHPTENLTMLCYWLLFQSDVSKHPELTGGGHAIQRTPDRLVRDLSAFYLQDTRWLFPVLRIKTTLQRAVVASVSWGLDTSNNPNQLVERYGPDIPLHATCFEAEVCAILDTFTKNYEDSTAHFRNRK